MRVFLLNLLGNMIVVLLECLPEIWCKFFFNHNLKKKHVKRIE